MAELIFWNAAATPVSPAALSDDFGDFEEADLELAEDSKVHQNEAQPPLPIEPAIIAKQALSSAVPLDRPNGPPETRQTAYAAAGPKHISAAFAPQSVDGEDEGMEEDEIPWYVDPGTYKRPRAASASVPGKESSSSDLVSDLVGTNAPAPISQPSGLSSQSQQLQPQRPPHLPGNLTGSGPPATFAREQPGSQGPPWSLPVRHAQSHEAEPDFHQEAADPKPSLPLPLLHDLDRISTSPRAAPLHFPAPPHQQVDVLAEARAAHLPLYGGQAPQLAADSTLQQQLMQQQLMQQEELARQTDQSRLLQGLITQQAAEAEGWQPPLRSYSDAWTQMVEVCFLLECTAGLWYEYHSKLS